jgi:hypothetical protein
MQLSLLIAQDHAAELRREAERERLRRAALGTLRRPDGRASMVRRLTSAIVGRGPLTPRPA